MIGIVILIALFFFHEQILDFLLTAIFMIGIGIVEAFKFVFGLPGRLRARKRAKQAEEERLARKQQQAEEAARRKETARKLHDFTSMSQLPDDILLLKEMQENYAREGDMQRAFVCKMRIDELSAAQQMTRAAEHPEEALEAWKEAAAYGSPEGAYRAAEALAAKAETINAWTEAKKLAEKAVHGSYPNASALLTRINNDATAFLDSVQQVLADAQAAYDEQRWKDAIPLWRKARSMGCPDCAVKLVFCYLYSAEREDDYEQALFWIDCAKAEASSDNVRNILDGLAGSAHFSLGLLHSKANRRHAALQHCRKSSDLGHGQGALMTALLLAETAERKSDLDEVERYARLALSRGEEQAEETLKMIDDIRHDRV